MKPTTAQNCFPSGVRERLAHQLNLDEWLVPNKAASYIVEVKDNAFAGSGIVAGSHVLLDRGTDPQNGDIVAVQIDNRRYLRYIYFENGRPVFKRGDMKKMWLGEHQSVEVHGVIRWSLNVFR